MSREWNAGGSRGFSGRVRRPEGDQNNRSSFAMLRLRCTQANARKLVLLREGFWADVSGSIEEEVEVGEDEEHLLPVASALARGSRVLFRRHRRRRRCRRSLLLFTIASAIIPFAMSDPRTPPEATFFAASFFSKTFAAFFSFPANSVRPGRTAGRWPRRRTRPDGGLTSYCNRRRLEVWRRERKLHVWPNGVFRDHPLIFYWV